MLRYVQPVVLIVMTVWAVLDAVRSGVFVWGTFGAYSSIPYLLVLGMLSQLIATTRSVSRNAMGLFLLMFIGYWMALGSLTPSSFASSKDVEWAFLFVACITAASVMAAGMAVQKEL